MPASNYLIAGNDEHGVNPPTAGKRTPIMPYVNRSFYENEHNRAAKTDFLIGCLRCGFNVYDVKPEKTDTSVATRVARVNAVRPTLLVNFGYNAFGSGLNFNDACGYSVFYSQENIYRTRSRTLSEDIYEKLSNTLDGYGRGVSALSDVGMLSSVRCPATLIESGYMTCFDEAKKMLDPDFVSEVAEAAVRGVCENLGVAYVAKDALSAYPTLRSGQRGNKVKLLQLLLSTYNFDLTADGVFGTNTLAAVKKFQTDNSLTADGIVGPNTWRALLNLNDPKNLSVGSRGAQVFYLQRKLLSKLYPLTVDGVFGPNTQTQVKHFQSENGLTADGIVGPATRRALEQSSGRPRLY